MTARLRPAIILALIIQSTSAIMNANLGAQGPEQEGELLMLETPTGKIGGTLLMPKARGAVPLAVIIPGSGPTDRNGNSPLNPGANNGLKLLAEGLASNGIASLRYDKRGIGASSAAMVSESNLRFDNGADDAAAWVERLRKDPRFSAITIVGHSEGSLLGMLAAQRSSTDGYVSIAGAGRPADKILRDQLSKQLPPDLLASANRALDTLLAGHTVESPPPQLNALFRPSVQPYLISWLKVDPQAEIAKLTIPVLITQGTLDAQVPESEAKLLAAAQPKAKLLVVDGMNHVMKRSAADQASQAKSYSDPTIPIPPELITGISTFIKSVARRK
jgi:pimeloyl-ACP methyl ester carboxylesterase